MIRYLTRLLRSVHNALRAIKGLNPVQFHMTLSGNMPEDKNGHYLQWLTALYSVMVPEPPIHERLSLFQQTDRKLPFVRIAEYPFAQA